MTTSEEKKCCPDPRGNELCTNGKDTYHEWNMREGSGCTFCEEKLPKGRHSTPVREELEKEAAMLQKHYPSPELALLERLEEEVGKLPVDLVAETEDPRDNKMVQAVKLSDVLSLITNFKKEI